MAQTLEIKKTKDYEIISKAKKLVIKIFSTTISIYVNNPELQWFNKGNSKSELHITDNNGDSSIIPIQFKDIENPEIQMEFELNNISILDNEYFNYQN